MESNIFYFYSLFFLMTLSAIGVILAPKMYMSVISLFGLVTLSSLLYLGLNSQYVAIFQFILCGLFLSVYIFLLLKKICRLNLGLKLASTPKIIISTVFTITFGIIEILFFKVEFNNSLYSIFNFITEKSTDVINFQTHGFQLQLLIILLFVTAIILRIFLSNLNTQGDKKND